MSPTLIAVLFCGLLEPYLKFRTPLTTVAFIYSCELGANSDVSVNAR